VWHQKFPLQNYKHKFFKIENNKILGILKINSKLINLIRINKLNVIWLECDQNQKNQLLYV